MAIKWTEVESSNIEAIGYDEEDESLYVRFNSKTQYVYYNVPDEEHQEFLDADSKGKFLNENIKGQYEYARV